jgi:hypothetical protein
MSPRSLRNAELFGLVLKLPDSALDAAEEDLRELREHYEASDATQKRTASAAGGPKPPPGAPGPSGADPDPGSDLSYGWWPGIPRNAPRRCR